MKKILMLIMIAVGIMITPAFAVSLPYPAFTNITDLGSPSCGITYVDADYTSPMSVRLQDGTVWAAMRRECGSSNNGVIGVYKSTNNGSNFSHISDTIVCTGDVGSAADLRMMTVDNEIFVETYCGNVNSYMLERLNTTDGSVISSVSLHGQSSCASNSTSLWCIEVGNTAGNFSKYTYDSMLNELNSTTFAKPVSANGAIGGMQMTSENLLEFIFWDGFTKAYYVNVTNTGVTASSYTGVDTADHATQDSMIVLPDGTKLYTYRCGVARSTDGTSWSTSDPFGGVCDSANPHIAKYGDEPILVYYDGSAGFLKYKDSDDSGATWESSVIIVDTPSQGYRANFLGYQLPAYNNYESKAGYFTIMVGSQGNNNLSFAPILYADVMAPDVTIQQPIGSPTSPFDIKFMLDHESVLNSTIDSCWYSLDGASNVSLPSCANTTATASVGSHSITIYANDTSGNIGSSISAFSVRERPITGTTANIIGFLPLLMAVGLMFMIIRKLEDMKDIEDFVAVIVGTGLAVAFIGVFVAIVTGLI